MFCMYLIHSLCPRCPRCKAFMPPITPNLPPRDSRYATDAQTPYNSADCDATGKRQMIEFVLVFAILALALGAYWALVIFPKQRAFKHKQQLARALHVGDEIITYGGIVGKIVDIDVEGGHCSVQIAEGVTIKLLTAALQGLYDAGELARNANIGQTPTPSEKTGTD